MYFLAASAVYCHGWSVLSRVRLSVALIAFQKRDGHTYKHTNIQLPIPDPQSAIQCLALMRLAIMKVYDD